MKKHLSFILLFMFSISLMAIGTEDGTTQTNVPANYAVAASYTITTKPSDPTMGRTWGDTIAAYDEIVTIYAEPFIGYDFVSWDDGDTDNPRDIWVEGDMTYIAEFEPILYTITYEYDENEGMIDGAEEAEYLEEIVIEAIPNDGYDFVKWSDGVTENPRNVIIDKDTTFGAEFEALKYTITTEPSDPTMGRTWGDTIAAYDEIVTIYAEPFIGYDFVSWDDGDTDNPRDIWVEGDMTYIAEFEPIIYTITYEYDENEGMIDGAEEAEYLEEIVIEAIPNDGYDFVKWSDGVTENPRNVIIDKDTTFRAEFETLLSPTITYELNGGVTNDYGWMSKSDMFQACMEDAYGYDIGISLNEFKQDNNPYIYLLSTLEFNVSHCQNILDNSRWDWLEDYLVMIQEESVAATLTKGYATVDWRYAIAAFFFEGQYSTSSDYSQFGKYEEYILAWKHGFDNPTEPTSDWVLNAPYKEGYSFAGWYATPDFSGNKITTINASTTGTLYAKWQENSSIYFVNAQNWTTVNVYAWTTDPNASWPGVAATKEAEQIAGHDVYSYTVEAGTYANVIFNNGSGQQTADLVWTAGKYYVRDGWYTKEEAEAKLAKPVEFESVYFVDNQGWGKANIYTWTPEVGGWPGVPMTKEAEQLAGYDVYSYTVEKGTSFGGFIFNNGSGQQTADLVWTAGKYYVHDGWYTKEEAEAKLTSLVTPPGITYVLMGVAGDWTTGIAMTVNPYNDNEYVLFDQEITTDDSVKVVTLTNGVATAWCTNVDRTSTVEYTITEAGNIVLTPGKYDFYFKVKQDLIYIGAVEPVTKPEPTYTENSLNPYAFGLESKLSDDKATLTVTYRLNNSNATSVNILVYNGEEVVATVAGGTTIGKNTVALATANLPKGVRLTWGVEVNGTSVEVPTQEAKTYSFYHPSGLDIDNNPENATFGMLLINEGMQHVKGVDGYVSTGYGAGIYAFTPSFDLLPNADQSGYNGGVEFTETRADGTGTAYAPRRIRISEDGRIFVTSLNTDGNYLWEVNPANMNEWTSIFSGELNDNRELVDAEGNFVAAPNTGFDVKGAGENLQLAMYSVNLPGFTAGAMSGFRLHEYNLGTATTWATAPSKTIVDGLYAINYTGTQVEYDNEGGVWIASYRGTASDANPGLVHINADGVEDAKLIWNNIRQAGIRFNNDFTKLVVAGNNGAIKKATIYSISKDANGAPVLTEETVIDMAVVGNNLNDFAWDYAGNLYSCSNSAEKLAAWAMPYSGTVVTPAAAEYAFQIGESIYFVNVDNWANVYVFAWNERSSIASWPGVTATKEIEQIAGIDVYSFTDEAGKWKNVIFSNNVGDKTYDLIWTSGKYYVKDGWYTKEEAESKLSPTITYELNGGITNDYGWMSKGDMFTACITDALGYDLGMTLDEFKQSATPFDDLFVFFGKDSLCQNILDNARWDWLEEYLITIQEEDQLAVPLTKCVASKDWRYAIAAFFFESQYDTSSDYSQAGTDEAYIPYWKHGYDNPTQPTQEWVLNAPYKENYLFDGWYATKTFTDEPITTVNASTNGTLYAKWKNEIVSSDTVGICFYDTYYWDINDEIYDRTGTYYATDEEGKHVLHLTVYPLTEDVEIFDTIRAGEIYDFEGRELTQTGTYYEAMLDDNGCDYTITLHLTVVHEEYVNICQGETYTWAVNSQIYSETGTYNLTTNDGIFILHLTVNPLIYTEETITTCDSYQWNGQTYTQSGDYTYTTTATNGCDSTITLHLTINQTQYAEETITACDSYTWNGQTYTQSGDYTYSTTAINGCDSIATLHLLVYQSKHKEEYITACDNYEWNGQTYTESGTYTHTSTTIDGCDSIVTLHLTINYSEVGETENVTICYGETYTWNGQTYSTAGAYSVTLSNTNGCDSTATLHLTIMPQAQEEVQYETINKKETPFIWQKNGKKYYETTTDSIFIPYTHHDCDSMIYILDLTVVDIEDVRAEYDTICESALPYEWHGQSITTGGRYEYTEKYGDTNIDILHVLYLTVIPTIRTQQSATICYEETFAWNGNTYSQTGTYTYTTEAANGCDSVVTLYLTVLPPAITIYTDTMIAHVDLPYIWRGQYCDTSGEYTATIPFAANTACDSVIYVLNLTVESVNKCGADLSWEYDNGILTISGAGAMYDNPDLQSYRHESWYPYRVRQVILSDQLTHIGNVAFADCANLTNIDIPSSVTSIGDGAFSWTGLLSVTIPASVTELGEQVFETCNNLHTILYEGTPSSISNQTVHPFIGCVHLDTIITPAELWHCTSADPVLENRYGVPHKARYIEVTNGFLTNQAMKYIAKNASTLKVLDLTYATNTTLPYGALSDSYQLTTLYFPQQIEVIPESMIEGGRNLTEIFIPATVTEIGNHAFAGCTNVWRMTVEAILPPKVYANTFDGIDRTISLIVPAGSEDLYRQAEYWREFFIEHTNSPSPISNCQKILREDHILILREGKVYTTMGQLINVGE